MNLNTKETERHQKKITILIDLNKARKMLALSAGSEEEAKYYTDKCSDNEIKNEVLKHISCWAIKEVTDINKE